MRRDLHASVIAAVVLTLVFGVAYPLITTGVAQVLFPGKSNGSEVHRDGKLVGSRLIGQDFRKPVLGPGGKPKMDKDGNPVLEADPRWFQSRPSQSSYDGSATFFGNLGPNSRELSDAIKANLDSYLALERPTTPGLTARDVPVDAITQSGSGVDPDISEANARIQANRVARVRGIPVQRVRKLIDDNTDGRGLGFFGEPGVNVLELNLAIDREATR
jgi:potassium-transporting ATPase KdpC subunit